MTLVDAVFGDQAVCHMVDKTRANLTVQHKQHRALDGVRSVSTGVCSAEEDEARRCRETCKQRGNSALAPQESEAKK